MNITIPYNLSDPKNPWIVHVTDKWSYLGFWVAANNLKYLRGTPEGYRFGSNLILKEGKQFSDLIRLSGSKDIIKNKKINDIVHFNIISTSDIRTTEEMIENFKKGGWLNNQLNNFQDRINILHFVNPVGFKFPLNNTKYLKWMYENVVFPPNHKPECTFKEFCEDYKNQGYGLQKEVLIFGKYRITNIIQNKKIFEYTLELADSLENAQREMLQKLTGEDLISFSRLIKRINKL